MPPGRNKPCHCGSGRKYKKCCLDNDRASAVITEENLYDTQNDEALSETSALDLLKKVSSLDSLAQFEEFWAEESSGLKRETLAEVDEERAHPFFGKAFTLVSGLLHRATEGDAQVAWECYQREMKSTEAGGVEVGRGVEEVVAAFDAHDAQRVVTQATELLPRAQEAGQPASMVILHEIRGKSYLILSSGDRAENIEAAIEDFRIAASNSFGDEHLGSVLMHAGIAYRERVKLDRRRNLSQAVELFREAQGLFEASGAVDELALLKANLAGTLLDVEGEGRTERLREVVELCRSASEYFSPNSDPINWAIAQFNLALALQDLAQLGQAEIQDARACFEGIVAQADQMPESWIVGQAHCAIGRLQRIAAELSGDNGDRPLNDPSEPQQLQAEERALLEDARGHFEVGLPLTEHDWLHKRRGMALDDMAEVLTRLGQVDDAIAVGREALDILRPTTAPYECRAVGWRLGAQLADRGEWDDAAKALENGLEAAELSFHARIDTADREEQGRQAGELARWAAMAFTRVGRFRDAALALESSRTRELRRRLRLGEVEESALDELPSELRDEFISASALLLTSPLSSASADVGRTFQEVVQKIRMHPGMADFAAGPRWEDLTAAVAVTRPLVYVDPTPWGTVLVRISILDGAPEADALVLEKPTSTAVYNQLGFGEERLSEALLARQPVSFFAAIDAGDEAGLRKALERSLPWLGSLISRPTTEWLEDSGASSVTLVPCGPVAVIPLGAAPWVSEETERCMLDSISVGYAPSGFLAGRALERVAQDYGPPELLALVDTTLALAEPEVNEIAEHFGGRFIVGSDENAGSEFLRKHLAGITHLHFACHGRGVLFDSGRTGIDLPAGHLAAHELPTLDQLTSRLTVISACESAVPRLSDLAGEAFATSTAMLAAGSACVVASLWEVDDRATGLLMTRLYEELFNEDLDPPEALRRAQLWLRDLTDGGLKKFLKSHPPLESGFQSGEGRSRRATAKASNIPGRPFSHPDYWAPFIAVGA
jgi:tetratricopeptide (TPR) repeat protein